MVKKLSLTSEEKLSYLGEWPSLLTESQRQDLCDSLEVLQCSKNEVIYKEGDLARYLHCLSSGHMRLAYRCPDGRERILSLLHPIHLFGLRPFLARKNHMFSSSTIDDVILCRMPNSVVLNIMKHNSDFTHYMNEQAAVSTVELERRLLAMMGKHLRGRMAFILLYIKKCVGYFDRRWIIDIGLKREDLANMADMTTANAIRTLSAFASEGIISMEHRKIIINNLAELERISQME